MISVGVGLTGISSNDGMEIPEVYHTSKEVTYWYRV